MEILNNFLTAPFDWEKGPLIVLNLILIESLLSVDNAAVLATMVMDLPKNQRDKALKYGIIGAYVFRGICLLLASYLMEILWLKALGGLYLLYLCFDYFRSKQTETTEDDTLNKQESKIYKMTIGLMGPFWSTVAMVEVMDLAFSLDNVFAAVAMTPDLRLVWIGVFIGILAMRFVAQIFVRLIERFPFMEATAFLVIGILGVKLVSSYVCDFFFACATCPNEAHFKPGSTCAFLAGETADMFISGITVGVFVLPILTSLLFNFPKRAIVEKKEDKEVENA